MCNFFNKLQNFVKITIKLQKRHKKIQDELVLLCVFFKMKCTFQI